MKVKIKHIEDNKTDVTANVFCVGREVNLEYRLKGMTYGVTLSLPQAIEKGIIKYVKATNSFRSMEKGKVYKIVDTEQIDNEFTNEIGGIGINIGLEDCHYLHHSNFYPTVKKQQSCKTTTH